MYADGRVLSLRHARFDVPGGAQFVEQRLSPEGVELVRSGAVAPSKFLPPYHWSDLPAGAWAEHEGKPYVPAMYGACFWRVDSPLDVEAVLDLLPASAQALLRGSDPAWNPRCLEVSPEEARSLEEIMGSSRDDFPVEVGAWSLRDGNGDQVETFISLRPLFPDGRRLFQPAG